MKGYNCRDLGNRIWHLVNLTITNKTKSKVIASFFQVGPDVQLPITCIERRRKQILYCLHAGSKIGISNSVLRLHNHCNNIHPPLQTIEWRTPVCFDIFHSCSEVITYDSRRLNWITILWERLGRSPELEECGVRDGSSVSDKRAAVNLWQEIAADVGTARVSSVSASP